MKDLKIRASRSIDYNLLAWQLNGILHGAIFRRRASLYVYFDSQKRDLYLSQFLCMQHLNTLCLGGGFIRSVGPTSEKSFALQQIFISMNQSFIGCQLQYTGKFLL